MTEHKELAYRRVHRLTPLLRFWTVIFALLAIVVVNLDQELIAELAEWIRGDRGPAAPILMAIAAIVVTCLAVFLISQVWWAATGFRLDDEGVQLKRGVISTQLRSARYDRIQAVDVVEPFIARIFRLAAVRIETAGGNKSAIEIGFLPRAEADELREDLLAQVREGDQGLVDKHALGSGEPEYVVEPIPIWRSLVGTALRGTTIFGAAWTVFSVLGPAGFTIAVPVLLAIVVPVWNQINNSWRFNARLDNDDVLHLAYGLASRRRQAVPLARIHAISIMQPVLWRPLGWWSVSVSIAGYGAESSPGGTSRILPVGSKEQAMALAALVGPLDRSGVDAFADPEGTRQATYTSPRRARWVSPLDAHRQATTLYAHIVVVHSGWLVRRVALIEASHIQELSLRRGPLQYLLGLYTVRMDLVPGPVSMAGRDMEEAQARELLDLLRQRKLPELVASGPDYT